MPQTRLELNPVNENMHVQARELFDVIAKASQHCIDFSPQALSNTAWSFATMNHDAAALFHSIARTAQDFVDDFKPQELSNIAWAYATMNHDAPELFGAIATAAIGRIGEFNS